MHNSDLGHILFIVRHNSVGAQARLDNYMRGLCCVMSASVLLANASHLSPTLMTDSRVSHSGRGRKVNIY